MTAAGVPSASDLAGPALARARAKRVAQESLEGEGETPNDPANDAAPSIEVAEPDNWQTRLIRPMTANGPGALTSHQANAITILRNDINWRGVLAWDEFREQIAFRREPRWGFDDRPQEGAHTAYLEDDDATTRISAWLMRYYILRLDDAAVYRACRVVAKGQAFNSLRDSLDRLEWDGSPRLERWLSTYLGADDKPFVRFAGKAFCISAVARVYRPGCQVDHTLILEGEQDRGKSTALRIMFGDCFSETALDLASKDRFTNLRGVWCQSFDELASLSRADINAVKNFLTSPFDVYRPPYGAHNVKVKRQCVFAGTVNPQEGIGYLKDSTGNRRFWPVMCAVRAPINRDALARDREQLWAEAVALFKAGEPWHPVTEEQKAFCRAEQAKREEENPQEELVARWLAGEPFCCPTCKGSRGFGSNECRACLGAGVVRRPPLSKDKDGREYVTQAEVLTGALGIAAERVAQHSTRVAGMLAKLGWRPPADGYRVQRGRARVTPYYRPEQSETEPADAEATPGDGG